MVRLLTDSRRWLRRCHGLLAQAAGAVVFFLPEETQGRPLQDLAGAGGHGGYQRGRGDAAPEAEMVEFAEGASLLQHRRQPPGAAGVGEKSGG